MTPRIPLVITIGALVAASPLSAQVPVVTGSRPGLRPTTPAALSDPQSRPRTTVLEFKLLTSDEGGGLYSQQWARLFETLDVPIQIQRANSTEKPEVKNRDIGTIRYVSAVGTLERNGRIKFEGRTFELSDGPRLKEWITELKTYGAQGSPEGQPNWGLNKEQFGKLYDSLNKRSGVDLREAPIREAIAKLPIPPQYPVRWSQAAIEQLLKPGAKTKCRQDLHDFSVATALAIALNDCHLGFRPNRTPTEGLEFLIEPLGQRKDQWPIGWPLQQQRLKAAPKLFAMTTIELDQVNLADVLTAAAEITDTAVVLDYYEIEQKNIDIEKLTVSIKRSNALSWSIALRNTLVPKKLAREIWQDESGKTFVWVTTNRPGRQQD